jgi:hypothetical protein
MHTRIVRMRVAFLAALAASSLLACTRVETPYSKIPNPPLLKAQLHTMTVLATADGLGAQLATRGYSRTTFPLGNAGALRVEAALWQVPEEVIAQTQYFVASSGPSLRLMVGLLPEDAPGVDDAVLREFYRNVLGVEPPHWPANVPRPENVRVHGWTYAVPSVVEASRRCREQGIPVDFAPVAISTAYLGDHRTMAIRAPDGAILELFEGAAR